MKKIFDFFAYSLPIFGNQNIYEILQIISLSNLVLTELQGLGKVFLTSKKNTTKKTVEKKMSKLVKTIHNNIQPEPLRRATNLNKKTIMKCKKIVITGKGLGQAFFFKPCHPIWRRLWICFFFQFLSFEYQNICEILQTILLGDLARDKLQGVEEFFWELKKKVFF